MSFFGMFGKKSGVESIAFFDIGPISVGAAYATFGEALPVLHYGRRMPISAHEGETVLPALERTIQALGEQMIKEGGPALLRATGSTRPSRVIVSMASPWQQTIIRVEQFVSPHNFTFSQKEIKESLAKRPPLPAGYVLAEETVIGTRLNGYDTKDAVGKEAKRANVIILTSIVDERAAASVSKVLTKLYHAHASLFTSFAATAERGFRALFPPEQEFIVAVKRGASIDLLLVRHGILAATETILQYKELKDLAGGLTALAAMYPLPNTIFFLAEDADLTVLQAAFSEKLLTSLWLSSNPPRTIPIAPANFTNLMKAADPSERDSALRLLVVSYAHRKDTP